MNKIMISAAVALAITFAGSSAKAQVNLSEYADPEGFLDIQTLTCAQLAGTWQDQADLLASWYSGWYNGLAKKHYMDIRKGREAEHELTARQTRSSELSRPSMWFSKTCGKEWASKCSNGADACYLPMRSRSHRCPMRVMKHAAMRAG